MKAVTVYFIICFLFLSLYVQKGANEKCDNLNKGDIVGVFMTNTFKMAYDEVLEEGKSPFGDQEICEYFGYKDVDFETYKTNVVKYLGNLSPGVIIKSESLAKGDLIGAVSPNTPGITYRVVKQDGEYPFDNETMVAYYSTAHPGYMTMLKKYLREPAPLWVTDMADELHLLYNS
ncbi:uncharacterized protein LOC126839659 [Adelges cooleyi]|uniref:uncharacterized protein LOC126839659 n=1 Tax=Adelges cooleyi TaxID=133065 RepID=UPI00217F9C70|nr:uncharacterized protein LOC126839659 [Adelges cooleyi]